MRTEEHHQQQATLGFRGYVLQGEFRFKVGDRVVSGPVGTFVFLPRGEGHTFQNISTEPGVLLGGVLPGGGATLSAPLFCATIVHLLFWYTRPSLGLEAGLSGL